MDEIGDADAARAGQGLEPGRHIDRIAEDITVLEDDIAEIDADAVEDALRFVGRPLPFLHRVLDDERRAHRVLHTREGGDQPVARGLDDGPAEALEGRVDQLAAVALLPVEDTRLVELDEPAVARHVGGDDRGQPSICAVCVSTHEAPLLEAEPANSRRCATGPPLRAALVNCP